MAEHAQAIDRIRAALETLMGREAPHWTPAPADSGSLIPPAEPGREEPQPATAHPRTRTPTPTRRLSAHYQTQAAIQAAPYRSDKLSVLLADMASRAGFDQVVLSDGSGLPLAAWGAESEGMVLSALAAVLGEALARVGDFLEAEKGESISVDVGYTDKLVLRRFDFASGTFYIMVLCGQDIDERSELELSVDEIRRILEQG